MDRKTVELEIACYIEKIKELCPNTYLHISIFEDGKFFFNGDAEIENRINYSSEYGSL